MFVFCCYKVLCLCELQRIDFFAEFRRDVSCSPSTVHPCQVLAFSDKCAMVCYDKACRGMCQGSCVPWDFADGNFYKYSESRCIYCNGVFSISRQVSQRGLCRLSVAGKGSVSRRMRRLGGVGKVNRSFGRSV